VRPDFDTLRRGLKTNFHFASRGSFEVFFVPQSECAAGRSTTGARRSRALLSISLIAQKSVKDASEILPKADTAMLLLQRTETAKSV
jgi:hypothetical protein